MMECIDPGAVTPEDLVAYAGGDGDARTAGHVTACAACADQAAGYATSARILSSRLFRVDCPPALTLGELALGMLEPEDGLTMRTHLALCPHCRADLATLEGTLREDPLAALAPAPGRLARIVARLLPAPGRDAAYAGVRGSGASGSRTYDAGGLTVSLTVEAEGGGAVARWALLGLVVDEEGGTAPSGAPIRLLRDGRAVDEAPLDEAGNVVFGALEAGAYDLEIVLDERVVAVEGIAVGGM